MSKKRAPKSADAADETQTGDTTPFVAIRSANAGSWQYYDNAGRLYRGYKTEEAAQAAADSHVPLENDPTEDE